MNDSPQTMKKSPLATKKSLPAIKNGSPTTNQSSLAMKKSPPAMKNWSPAMKKSPLTMIFSLLYQVLSQNWASRHQRPFVGAGAGACAGVVRVGVVNPVRDLGNLAREVFVAGARDEPIDEGFDLRGRMQRVFREQIWVVVGETFGIMSGAGAGFFSWSCDGLQASVFTKGGRRKTRAKGRARMRGRLRARERSRRTPMLHRIFMDVGRHRRYCGRQSMSNSSNRLCADGDRPPDRGSHAGVFACD
jgi:hypothetical protein